MLCESEPSGTYRGVGGGTPSSRMGLRTTSDGDWFGPGLEAPTASIGKRTQLALKAER